MQSKKIYLRVLSAEARHLLALNVPSLMTEALERYTWKGTSDPLSQQIARELIRRYRERDEQTRNA